MLACNRNAIAANAEFADQTRNCHANLSRNSRRSHGANLAENRGGVSAVGRELRLVDGPEPSVPVRPGSRARQSAGLGNFSAGRRDLLAVSAGRRPLAGNRTFLAA